MFEVIDLGTAKNPEQGDTVKSACEKCNLNFSKISDKTEMIQLDDNAPYMPQLLKIFISLKHNSQLLGFDYPEISEVTNDAGQIKPRALFDPVVRYFNSLK